MHASDDEVAVAVASATNLRGALRALGMNPSGMNYPGLRREIIRLGLDTSHWREQAPQRRRIASASFDDILVVNSAYTNPTRLKERLLRAGLLRPECYECGINEWRGAPLVLIFDHVNGVKNDHRLENLRLLCPNCDAQVATWRGRNKRP